MREKRRETIDTPGVIKRVADILVDHRDLILNFNAFLPLGYKVEVDGTTGDTTLDAQIAAETAEGKVQFITTPAPSLPSSSSSSSSSLAGTNPATLAQIQGAPTTMTPAQMVAVQQQQQQFAHLQMQRQQLAQQQLAHQQQHQQSLQQQTLHMQQQHLQMQQQANFQQQQHQQQMQMQHLQQQQQQKGGPFATGQFNAQGVPQPQRGTFSGILPQQQQQLQMQHHYAHLQQQQQQLMQRQQAAQAAAAAPPIRGAAPPPRTGPPPPAPLTTSAAPGASSGAAATAPKPQFEFLDREHALSYVTKIKRRFTNEPERYQQFLLILQAYQGQQQAFQEATAGGRERPSEQAQQKRQLSIREVLDRVSELFQDHPDLLSDFTYFLPDAVQVQARDRIRRTMEITKERKNQAMRAEAERRYGDSSGVGSNAGGAFGKGGPGGDKSSAASAVPPARDRERLREVEAADAREYAERNLDDRELSLREREKEREKERLVDKARDRSQVGMGAGKSPRVQAVVKKRRQRDEEMCLALTPSEKGFFERVKSLIGPRDTWVEFLKLLELFSCEVLNRAELISLVSDILTNGTGGSGGSGSTATQSRQLLEELKSLIANKGFTDLTPQDVWYSMPIAEVDLSQCQRCTPSYRCLPEGYPILSCSERSRAEQAVLNDQWVSVPTGSEDFSFKISRKNAYEDALFHCEDERHEVDQCIENNASCMRILEPLAEEIAVLKEYTKGGIEWQFRLDRRSLGRLHLKAIARVYGEHGAEILELLRKNPGGAIPVILRRLKAKDEEWRRARRVLGERLKRVMEDNFYKSLDHRSFYFKQADGKAIRTKSLVAELKAKIDEAERELQAFVSSQEEVKAEELKAKNDATKALSDAAAETKDDKMVDVDEPVVASKSATTGVPAVVSAKSAHSDLLLAPTTILAATLTEGTKLPRSLCAKLRATEPVLHLQYKDLSLHKDAYLLLFYAVECSLPNADKPLCVDLWRSYIGRYFGLPRFWQNLPNLAASAHGYTSADVTSELASFDKVVVGSESVHQLGEVVSTPYGAGYICDVRIGHGGSRLSVLPNESEAQEPSTGINMSTQTISKKDTTGKKSTSSGSAVSSSPPPPLFYEVVLDYGHAFLLSSCIKTLNSPKPTSKASKASEAAAVASLKETTKRKPLIPRTSLYTPVAKSSSITSSSSSSPISVRADIPGGVMVGSTHYSMMPPPPSSSVTYVSAAGYSFFRLHQLILDRLASAKVLCAREKNSKEARGASSSSSFSSSSSAAAVNTLPLKTGASNTNSRTGGNNKKDSADMVIDDDDKSSEGGESHYRHFVTALYGVLDQRLDSGRFEDECRELMGTSAYLLFTLDKVILAAAKQLSIMAHDSTSIKLKNLWETAVAKSTLAAQASRSNTAAEADVASALATYRAGVSAVLQPRGDERDRQRVPQDECFVVQYLPLSAEDVTLVNEAAAAAALSKSSKADTSSSSVSKANTPINAANSATLTIRLLGKALAVTSASLSSSSSSSSSASGSSDTTSTFQQFQYSPSIPSFLGRQLCHGKYLIGDESAEIENEVIVEDEDKLILGKGGLPILKETGLEF
jgi:histone deacetylase complex regulatory component SIN3